jgi:hypothetical protein
MYVCYKYLQGVQVSFLLEEKEANAAKKGCVAVESGGVVACLFKQDAYSPELTQCSEALIPTACENSTRIKSKRVIFSERVSKWKPTVYHPG